MAAVFSADEVLQIAEQIERNGESFYRAVAQRVPEESQKQVLLSLAGMEETHRKTFSEMRANLRESERQPTTFDPEGQTADYLLALADRRVFDIAEDPTELLTGEEVVEEILCTAIDLEKDSIIFYLGMKDVVPPKFGGGKLDAIIKEEMNHITILTRQLAAIIEND